MLRAVEPSIVWEAAGTTAEADAARASPGMASKHYAPRAKVTIAARGATIVDALREASGSGARVGVVVWSDEARAALDAKQPVTASFVAKLPDEAAGYARALFAAFYDADEAKVETLLVEAVPSDEAWWAVADRLRRSASSR
jgi:L-threonylcarbamoyladenylate synthase